MWLRSADEVAAGVLAEQLAAPLRARHGLRRPAAGHRRSRAPSRAPGAGSRFRRATTTIRTSVAAAAGRPPRVRPLTSAAWTVTSSVCSPDRAAAPTSGFRTQLQDVHAENRADQAERKRDAVTHRRLAVPRGLHRRLHRRRVRAGAGEQAGHHRVRHVHDRQLDEGHPERAEQCQPGQQVVAAAGLAGQAGKELLPEHDAEPVEEHDEAERADDRWRLRLRGDRPDEQPGEEHGPHAEREPLDVHRAEGVARRR